VGLIVPRVTAFGESALLIELGDVFDESLAGWARALALQWSFGPAVPAYASVVVSFDPERIEPEIAERRAREMLARGTTYLAEADPARPDKLRTRLIEIPTRYDGPDIGDTASRSGMSVDELVTVHSGREYSAIFVGFMPGFAYLGRLDARIVAPRLERPRAHVPGGSVAIADGQTGVYPFTSPGGWRLIGSTDVVMFDPSADEPARIRAGDRVRFVRR
jgi:KipI family sensor histidine kinase inhibitor